ncbi:MAG TPA: LPS export ABC transporter periplasmic protein LptC [Syntrophales bacterium]|nr:LPS export ABC transporter periplasmic protein LptC [Syntrophales bacterium]
MTLLKRIRLDKRAAIIIAVIVMVISVATAVMVMESKESSQGPPLRIMSDNVDLQVKDINYTDVGDSGLKWEIKADTAKYVKSENLAMFDKVRVKLVMEDGRAIIMTGDKAKLHTDTKDMEISGNVIIISEKGDRLTTDILKYSGSEQRIYTEAIIKMENPRMQVMGRGMSLSLKDEDVALLSRVKANIK